MQRPLLSLLALIVFTGTLNATDKPCKPCGEATSPVTVLTNNNNNLAFGCSCPLFPFFTGFWYGEAHWEGSACLSPQAVLFPGSYVTGTCVTATCTGNGCFPQSSLKKEDKISPILDKPVSLKFFPVVCKVDPPKTLKEHARNCVYADPRYITFTLKDKRVVTAKLFAVLVDVKKRTKSGKENPQRHQQLAFMGYECVKPTVEPIKINIKSEDARHVVVDLVAYQGIVLLAKPVQ